jgi:hypothetical protein
MPTNKRSKRSSAGELLDRQLRRGNGLRGISRSLYSRQELLRVTRTMQLRGIPLRTSET